MTPNNEIVFELELENGQNVYCANKANWNFDNGTLSLYDQIRPVNIGKLNIHPNPSHSKFNVNVEAFKNTKVRIQVCSLNGLIIYEKEYGNVTSEKYIQVEHYFAPGSYIVKCTAGSTVSFANILVNP